MNMGRFMALHYSIGLTTPFSIIKLEKRKEDDENDWRNFFLEVFDRQPAFMWSSFVRHSRSFRCYFFLLSSLQDLENICIWFWTPFDDYPEYFT